MLKLKYTSLARAFAHSASLATVAAWSMASFGVGCSSDAAPGGASAGGSSGAAHAGAGNAGAAVAGSGSAGKSGSGGASNAGAGGGAGAAGSSQSGGGSGGTPAGGAPAAGSGGGAPVDPALDAACTAACAKQTGLDCIAMPSCHDACVALATGDLSPGHPCQTKYSAMLQCTSKLTAAQWTCAVDDGKAVPIEGQCTSTVCPWACCASDLIAGTELFARCACE
jgi:hypothetical protein